MDQCDRSAAPRTLLAPTRVSVLGVGVMGRLHSARVLCGFDAALRSWSACYDPERAPPPTEVRASHVGVCLRAFSQREGRRRPAADLVVIASPIECHAGAAARQQALAAEGAICSRREAALRDGPESLRHSPAPPATGKHLFVGHSERWNPAIRALRLLVTPADIRTLRIRRTATSVRPTREHGALVSLGVHDLDLIAYLTASAVAVRDVVRLDHERADLVLSTSEQRRVAWLYVDAHAQRRERLLEVVTNDAVYEADTPLARASVPVRPHDAREGAGWVCAVPTGPRGGSAGPGRPAIARALGGGSEPVRLGDGWRTRSRAGGASGQLQDGGSGRAGDGGV